MSMLFSFLPVSHKFIFVKSHLVWKEPCQDFCVWFVYFTVILISSSRLAWFGLSSCRQLLSWIRNQWPPFVTCCSRLKRLACLDRWFKKFMMEMRVLSWSVKLWLTHPSVVWMDLLRAILKRAEPPVSLLSFLWRDSPRQLPRPRADLRRCWKPTPTLIFHLVSLHWSNGESVWSSSASMVAKTWPTSIWCALLNVKLVLRTMWSGSALIPMMVPQPCSRICSTTSFATSRRMAWRLLALPIQAVPRFADIRNDRGHWEPLFDDVWWHILFLVKITKGCHMDGSGRSCIPVTGVSALFHLEVITGVVLTAVCMSSFISTDMVDSHLGRDLGSRMKKVRARSMA